MKLVAFLLPLVFLLIILIAAAVTRIMDDAIRNDLLQRGVAISRVVALSSGYSILSGDRLAMDRLAAETKNSSGDIEYVAIRDTENKVLAHNRIEERGQTFLPSTRVEALGTFLETHAHEVVRRGKRLIEFNTPIFFAGKRVGTVSFAISRDSLVAAQTNIRRSIALAAAVFLGIALLGTVAIASFITTPVKKLSSGVNELASGAPFHPIPFRSGDELGELTRNFNRMAETILSQKNRLSRYAKDLEESYIATVRVLAASIDARDPYTLGHSTRVSFLSCELARRLGFAPEEIEHLEKACLFHDVGKIRTPDDILLKEQRLNPREIGVIQRHPDDGADILRMAPSLHRYIPVVRYHHEWHNGNGYPEGRRGSEIPIHAQIIALADAFDAITTTRPYRKGLTSREALEEIFRFRGTQFSPELTDAFVRMVQEMPPMEAVSVDTAGGRGIAL
ncbi:MAG TPA: HD domain-containing phosphohydrolase [Candidatus Deferrimicrobiaceae bacterium]|nr:HD domain-containing phosphohydrolase [Candidatus Deferrimicrobiaceae bacterium]